MKILNQAELAILYALAERASNATTSKQKNEIRTELLEFCPTDPEIVVLRELHFERGRCQLFEAAVARWNPIYRVGAIELLKFFLLKFWRRDPK